MARRKPENMIEATAIRESETVATAEAKGHSDQRFVRRLVVKSCGKHYGEIGGDCHKCRKPDCQTKEGLLAVFNATFYPSTW